MTELFEIFDCQRSKIIIKTTLIKSVKNTFIYIENKNSKSDNEEEILWQKKS